MRAVGGYPLQAGDRFVGEVKISVHEVFLDDVTVQTTLVCEWLLFDRVKTGRHPDKKHNANWQPVLPTVAPRRANNHSSSLIDDRWKYIRQQKYFSGTYAVVVQQVAKRVWTASFWRSPLSCRRYVSHPSWLQLQFGALCRRREWLNGSRGVEVGGHLSSRHVPPIHLAGSEREQGGEHEANGTRDSHRACWRVVCPVGL